MRVTGLYRYPLKSAAGVAASEVRLDAFGVEMDRRWAVLGAEGRAITQRECTALALLNARVTTEGIELRAPDGSVLKVRHPESGQPAETIVIWKDETRGIPAGNRADEWLTRVLNRPCRLLYMADGIVRPVSRRYGREEDRVGFADGYPLLLTSEASLAELNRRLERSVPMDRFRPNLVVDGEEPFAEDDWALLRVGDCTLRVVKHCARCAVTTIDQTMGIRGTEPLRTLATFRKRDGKVLFGENLIHDRETTIRIGDEVEVVERRPRGGESGSTA